MHNLNVQTKNTRQFHRGNTYIEYLVFAMAVGLATIVFLTRMHNGGDLRFNLEAAYDSLQQHVLGY